MINLQELLEHAVQQIGYEMVDLEISGRGKLLRLFIDKPEGITIDDCALVSEHVSHLLAVEHDVDYDRLEVSSPGLDRVLKKPGDFERFSGSRVQVKVRMPVEGRKNFIGTLQGLHDGKLKIECEGKAWELDFTNVDKTRLSPDFKAR